VITAFHAATRYERRMANFCLRSAFHDAMSIDVECAKLKKPDDQGYDCGGAGEPKKSTECCARGCIKCVVRTLQNTVGAPHSGL
jgi:hypothetical protein